MGLTVHFNFRAPPGTDAAAALRHVQALQRFCEDRPFAEVDRELVHFEGEHDCDFEAEPPEHPHRWLKVMSRESLRRHETLYHPDDNDLRFGLKVGAKCEIHYDVKPVEIIAFSAWPGAGCESVELGLARYPATIEFWDYRYARRTRRRVLQTRLAGQWRWGAFCKTQYASEKGLPHFLRCHLLVIAVLDRARELGLLWRVNDEGGYWRSRRLDALGRCVGEYNVFIGAMSKLLQEAAPPGHRVESEIEHHPDYEQFTIEKLAADFPEMHAAVARTAGLLRRAARDHTPVPMPNLDSDPPAVPPQSAA